MQSETDFKKKVQKALKTLPRTWFVKTQQVAIRGTPDLLCCVSGHFVAMELKRSAQEGADPLQLHTLDQIIAANGVGLLVSPENWPEVFKHLEALAYAG